MRLQQIASLSLLSLGLLTRHAGANPVPFPNALAFAEAAPQVVVCNAGTISCGSICCTSQQHCRSPGLCGEGAAAGGNVFTSTFLITTTQAAVITSLVVFTSGNAATATAVPTLTGNAGSSVIGAYPT